MKLLLSLAALVAIPTVAVAQPGPAVFLKKAGASDRYEIESSRLVMTSSNRKVRAFAQGMVRDHTQSTADIKAAAARARLRVPPPMLDAKGRRNVAALRAARGMRRDRLYIEQQRASHQEALALHQSNADGGRVPSLRRASAKIVPVVQHHIQMLAGM